jgi:general secretion pathway protein B
MSYILDALKKAERDRPAATVPTIETVHQAPPAAPARPLWPWVAAVVVLVNAGALIWLMRTGPMRSTGIPAGSPVTPVASAPATVTEQAVPARPADPAPRVIPSETPATVAAAPPPPSQPQPERTPAVPKRTETARGPSVALAPKPDARAEPAARPATEKPALSIPVPTIPPIASVPTRPGTASVAPNPPASGDISPGSPEFIQRMKLQVVVYSDVATQRLVFIDNRKYVEGQSIGGNVLLESIVPDGAIVLYEGKRIKLRASTD